MHFAFESKSCILYMSGESQYFSAIYLSGRKARNDLACLIRQGHMIMLLTRITNIENTR